MRQVPTPARQVAQPSNKATPLSNPRKRALSEEDIEELSPKRKKIKSTSNYIYQTLFRDGINSDLTIRALGTYTVLTVLCCIHSVRHCTGKEWKLHKVYLCQVRVCVCGVYVCVCVRPPPPPPVGILLQHVQWQLAGEQSVRHQSQYTRYQHHS